jgi:hypothetical protein
LMGTIRGVLRWMLPAAVLALPAGAQAQQTDVTARQLYRGWDISGGAAIRFGEHNDAVVPLGAWTAEIGRYWTSHLKTSWAVSTAGQENYGGDGAYNPAAVTRSSSESVTGPAAFAVSGAYQFFENDFVHPYVSVGARFASASTSTTVYSTRSPYQLLSTTETPARFEVRPTIGGGFKSYFGNGRAFMRSELLMSVVPHGSPNTILLIGAGVDF